VNYVLHTLVVLEYCYWRRGSWLLEKWNHHACRRVLFLIFLHCRFQGECQGKKQTFDCQQYPLLQAHLDRCDADNRQIKNCSVTKHQAGIKRSALIFYLYSWEVLDGSLPQKHVAQSVSIRIPIACWKPLPPNWTNMLWIKKIEWSSPVYIYY